jgi:Ras association domain-containing protein 9/10
MDPRWFAVVERWRKMERPLDPHSRILKAWNAWGDQKYEIKFSLRRLPEPHPAASKVKTAGGATSRRRPSSRRQWRHAGSPPRSEEHPRKFRSTQHQQESIEKLMKMILAQGETIRAQLGRLKDKEEDLTYFESR